MCFICALLHRIKGTYICLNRQEVAPLRQTLYWNVLCAHLFFFFLFVFFFFAHEPRMRWRNTNLHTTINLAFIFYFLLCCKQVIAGGRGRRCSMMCQIHIYEKATQDNNTRVQSSFLPSLSQEFVQSTKYTRSQFTAFICRLKWCQCILNSLHRGRVKNRKWQWVFQTTANWTQPTQNHCNWTTFQWMNFQWIKANMFANVLPL